MHKSTSHHWLIQSSFLGRRGLLPQTIPPPASLWGAPPLKVLVDWISESSIYLANSTGWFGLLLYDSGHINQWKPINQCWRQVWRMAYFEISTAHKKKWLLQALRTKKKLNKTWMWLLQTMLLWTLTKLVCTFFFFSFRTPLDIESSKKQKRNDKTYLKRY